MFRILIIEDNLDTLKLLERYIPEVVPGAQVHVADTVADGMDFLKQARPYYDIAILDFELPASRGGAKNINTTLCRTIKELRQDTFVLHITAYSDDPRVLAHLAEFHAGYGDPNGEIISKSSAKWCQELATKLRAYLYGRLIERQMEVLFGSTDEPSYAAFRSMGGSESRSGTSLTYRLATLAQDISKYWGYLSHSTQEQIKHNFSVIVDRESVRVSLL